MDKDIERMGRMDKDIEREWTKTLKEWTKTLKENGQRH